MFRSQRFTFLGRSLTVEFGATIANHTSWLSLRVGIDDTDKLFCRHATILYKHARIFEDARPAIFLPYNFPAQFFHSLALRACN
jgi:hypothetical protein